MNSGTPHFRMADDGEELERLEARARQKMREFADAAGPRRAVSLCIDLMRQNQKREADEMRSRR